MKRVSPPARRLCAARRVNILLLFCHSCAAAQHAFTFEASNLAEKFSLSLASGVSRRCGGP
jgi:hypothetical protein